MGSEKKDSSFENGVLETPDLTIKITDVKVIQPGAEGNQYGHEPVIAFWYQITNKSGREMTPMQWLFVFEAYQDNNPNAENELEVGSLPDSRFGETQSEKIKQGGTVESAMAYELTDTTTPVDLVASTSLGMDEIGKQTFPLQ